MATGANAWKTLAQLAQQTQNTHLRDLLQDTDRNASLRAEYNDILMDYSRQRVTNQIMDTLFQLAEEQNVREKITSMFNGDPINSTENRSVLHVALRATVGDADEKKDDAKAADIVEEAYSVVKAELKKVKEFSERVRSGDLKGSTGKLLTDFVCIGIGGSYLGAEFVAEALRTDPEAETAAEGRRLHFLANVDPIAVKRALAGFNPETTLAIVISKTFTTAETMLNARTVRDWISQPLGDAAVPYHVIACTAAIEKAQEFGIDPNNMFKFWDWVGGRYSVTSVVGMLPLSLKYGFKVMEDFLKGARDMDEHFRTASARDNLPMLLGLLGVWNSSFLGHGVRAVLPYSEALVRFAAHLQQVDMESNGKSVALDGTKLDFLAGEVTFGEPGTNGQHSFYQLIHQGRVIPCDFIGFIESQNPIELENETVSNHDELMSNFFAQPDALAYGKTVDELKEDGVDDELIPHKEFSGNRPSTSILLPKLDAYYVGQLLALYEHRVAVQGFVWGINSFDQYGVELGKVLGKKVRNQLHASRKTNAAVQGFNSSTTNLIERYLGGIKKSSQ